MTPAGDSGLTVTALTRDAGERSLARLTYLTAHGEPLSAYEKHVLVNRVVAAASLYGIADAAARQATLTALTADALLDKLAGLDQTTTGDLDTIAQTIIGAMVRAAR